MKVNNPPPARSDPKSASTPSPENAARHKDDALQTGQLLKGRVLEQTPDGRGVRLEIEGRLVVARNLAALESGKTYWLEVQRGGNQPWLGLAAQKGPVQELLRLVTADSSLLRQMVALLTTGSAQKSTGSLDLVAGRFADLAVGRHPDPAAIRRLVAGFGSVQEQAKGAEFEKVLAGLRAFSAGGEFPELPGDSGAGLDKLLRVLDSLREVNQPGPSSPGKETFYLFPCFLADAAGWGQWWLGRENQEKKTSTEAQYTLAFFLQFSQLGDLHLRLSLLEGRAVGELTVASEGVRKHLTVRLAELQNLLQRLELGRVQLNCRVAPGSVLGQWQAFLQEKAGLRPRAVLDVRV